MFCESCGKQVPPNSPTCPYCSPASYGPPGYGAQGPATPPPAGGYGGGISGTPTQYGCASPAAVWAPSSSMALLPSSSMGASSSMARPRSSSMGASSSMARPRSSSMGASSSMARPRSSSMALLPQPAGGGLADNVAGLLAYVTIIPAIIFLLIEPYRRNPFVRFHAFQCLGIALTGIVLQFGLGFMVFMTHIPFVGLLIPLVSLAAVHWRHHLPDQGLPVREVQAPIIGDFAEQMANKGF